MAALRDMASNFPRPSAFAALVPMSVAAAATTTMRRNLVHVSPSRSNDWSSTFPQKPIILLTFEAMFARNAFSFGTSRASDIQLPAADGVSMHHFIISFNVVNRTPYLRNTSVDQIRISCPLSGDILLGKTNPTFELRSPITISMGTNNILTFRLVVPESLDQQLETARLRYLLTINPPAPEATIRRERLRKRKASAPLAQSMPAPKRYCQHMAAPPNSAHASSKSSDVQGSARTSNNGQIEKGSWISRWLRMALRSLSG